MSNQEQAGVLVSQLVDSVREFAGLPECRNAARDLYGSLVRRVKLLGPLFDELKDSEQQVDDDDLDGLKCLKFALDLGLDLLKAVNYGSKTFQIDRTIKKFHQVTTQIEEALCKIRYDRFDVPEEIREQVGMIF
ncbi:hypothetical protein HanHA300_Chr09g0311491 [Helianthus annuus]|nr:hypothetical protein HanHA300_Chr09g0311491 [Helianthus annuus]